MALRLGDSPVWDGLSWVNRPDAAAQSVLHSVLGPGDLVAMSGTPLGSTSPALPSWLLGTGDSVMAYVDIPVEWGGYDVWGVISPVSGTGNISWTATDYDHREGSVPAGVQTAVVSVVAPSVGSVSQELLATGIGSGGGVRGVSINRVATSDTVSGDVALTAVSLRPPATKRLTTTTDATLSHKGLNSGVFVLPDGRRFMWWRDGLAHTVNSSTINGAWLNTDDTLGTIITLASEAGKDLGQGGSRVMANGRLGILVHRYDKAIWDATANIVSAFVGNKFIYCDSLTADPGNPASWTSVDIPSSDVARGWDGLHAWPASVGGNDVTGFFTVATTLTTPRNIAIITTPDNGATWTFTTVITGVGLGTTLVSEPSVARLGTTSRWVMLIRCDDGTAHTAIIAVSTNLTSWVSYDSQILVGQQRSLPWYDSATNELHWLVVSRGPYPTPLFSPTNAIVRRTVDADVFWGAPGVAFIDANWRRIASVASLVDNLSIFRELSGRVRGSASAYQNSTTLTRADLILVNFRGVDAPATAIPVPVHIATSDSFGAADGVLEGTNTDGGTILPWVGTGWSRVSGVARRNASADLFAWVVTAGGDCNVKATIAEMPPSGGFLGVVARQNPGASTLAYYSVRTSGTGVITLVVRTSGGTTTLATAAATAIVGTVLEIRCRGSITEMWVNGALAGSGEGTTYPSQPSNGSGVYSSGMRAIGTGTTGALDNFDVGPAPIQIDP